MHKYDYTFLKNSIPGNIVGLTDIIADLRSKENDYVPFIINILQVLYKCFKDLDESFTDISLKKAKKSERVESILMGAIVPISKQDIIAKVPDISVKTVELVLSKMLKEHKIKKIGTFKDARYMRNNNIEQ